MEQGLGRREFREMAARRVGAFADLRVDLRVGSLAAGVARALAVGVAPAPRGAAPGSVARYGGVPGRRFGGRPTASSASPGKRPAPRVTIEPLNLTFLKTGVGE